MPLQMTLAQAPRNQAIDPHSIDLTGIEYGQLQRSKSANRFAEEGITLSLVHLDVALAVKAEDRDAGDSIDAVPRFKVSAQRLANGSAETVSTAGTFKDPVIQRLSDALEAAEAAHGPHSAICADALRLAILTRQFSRQTDAKRTGIAAAEDHTGRNVKSLQKWRLKRVVEYVDENLAEKITLQDLATVAGLSRMHFAAQFRAAMGMKPHEYLMKRRIERAEELLKEAEVSLVEVALTIGFQTQAHFTTVFKRFAGDTPYQWRSAYLAQSAPLPLARASFS